MNYETIVIKIPFFPTIHMRWPIQVGNQLFKKMMDSNTGLFSVPIHSDGEEKLYRFVPIW